MKNGESKIGKLKYAARYTANTYIDYVLSIPLFITENTYRGIGHLEEKLKGRIEWADWDSIKEYTPGHRKRQALRDRWDTGKGVDMINSNITGLAAFFIAGPVVAEATYKGLEDIIPQNSELAREITTSVATSIAGYIAGNSTIIADFTLYRNRKDHLKEDGSLDWKKVYKTGKDFIVAALGFDIPFFGGKVLTQTALINQGMDPAPASMAYDTIGIFVWYTYLIPVSLAKKIIKPKGIEALKIQDNDIKYDNITANIEGEN